jgi:hypothetical protein
LVLLAAVFRFQVMEACLSWLRSMAAIGSEWRPTSGEQALSCDSRRVARRRSCGPACIVVPLTGPYPALTAVLAILFLREGVTVPKVLGIAVSMVAVYLLSR